MAAPKTNIWAAPQLNPIPEPNQETSPAINPSPPDGSKYSIKRTPPKSVMNRRKELIRSVAAKRIDKLLLDKSQDEKDVEWIQTLPDTSPTYKTKFAQKLIQKSSGKQTQGSIINYMRKRKISPNYLKKSKALKHDDKITTIHRKQLDFNIYDKEFPVTPVRQK